MKRAILIVLDSVGVGALPDAARYGDTGSDTVGNILRVRGRLDIPHLRALGLAKIDSVRLPYEGERVCGCYGKCAEVTAAKDTTSGHWEMAGLPLEKPFRTYPDGFPQSFIEAFEQRIGRTTLCNKPASGTAVIAELGDAHVQSGSPIVYTSADSVFQIAAHEDVIPLEELYRICRIAREMLNDDYGVARVIARPFTGTSGAYTRTENRRDFAQAPFAPTVLDALKAAGLPVVGIGKIEDIFASSGLTEADHTRNNHDGVEATLRYLAREQGGLIFTNLVDFDMLYGHRNDVEGYARSLESFDAALPRICAALREDDLLIVTADHGCDPTTESTDHSREYIPLLASGPHFKQDFNLGVRSSFADIGATVYEYLTGQPWCVGESFLSDIYAR